MDNPQEEQSPVDGMLPVHSGDQDVTAEVKHHLRRPRDHSRSAQNKEKPLNAHLLQVSETKQPHSQVQLMQNICVVHFID